MQPLGVFLEFAVGFGCRALLPVLAQHVITTARTRDRVAAADDWRFAERIRPSVPAAQPRLRIALITLELIRQAEFSAAVRMRRKRESFR